jgi:hypothetical protein
MQRARGPWWAALLLLAPSVIAGCDHDESDTATSSDVGAEHESAGSDDSNDDGGQASLTCRDLVCPDDQVCVEPRAYCDESVDPPELWHTPAYCRPLVSPSGGSMAMAEGTPISGIPMCDDPDVSQGLDGQVAIECPEIELPCG